MIVNISEAKTKLSKLIDMVSQGQEVVITKNNIPIAELVMHKPKGKRKLSLYKEKISIPDDFYEDNEIISELFYGKDE